MCSTGHVMVFDAQAIVGFIVFICCMEIWQILYMADDTVTLINLVS